MAESKWLFFANPFTTLRLQWKTFRTVKCRARVSSIFFLRVRTVSLDPAHCDAKIVLNTQDYTVDWTVQSERYSGGGFWLCQFRIGETGSVLPQHHKSTYQVTILSAKKRKDNVAWLLKLAPSPDGFLHKNPSQKHKAIQTDGRRCFPPEGRSWTWLHLVFILYITSENYCNKFLY